MLSSANMAAVEAYTTLLFHYSVQCCVIFNQNAHGSLCLNSFTAFMFICHYFLTFLIESRNIGGHKACGLRLGVVLFSYFMQGLSNIIQQFLLFQLILGQYGS